MQYLIVCLDQWYLIVIVLLYVGLLASFSLNVSLLLRLEFLALDIDTSDGF